MENINKECINEFDKHQDKDICNSELEKSYKSNYSNEFIKALERNIDKVTTFDKLKLSKVLNRPLTDNDIATFWSYKLYVEVNISDEKIFEVMKISEREFINTNIDSITYEWNSVKSELNYLKHGLKLSDAIELIKSTKSEKFKSRDDRLIIYGFLNNGIFATITAEYSEGRVIRIISFFESSKDKWNLARRKYERLY